MPAQFDPRFLWFRGKLPLQLKNRRENKRTGFTLVEMMVAVAITGVSILAAMDLFVSMNNVQKNATAMTDSRILQASLMQILGNTTLCGNALGANSLNGTTFQSIANYSTVGASPTTIKIYNPLFKVVAATPTPPVLYDSTQPYPSSLLTFGTVTLVKNELTIAPTAPYETILDSYGQWLAYQPAVVSLGLIQPGRTIMPKYVVGNTNWNADPGNGTVLTITIPLMLKINTEYYATLHQLRITGCSTLNPDTGQGAPMPSCSPGSAIVPDSNLQWDCRSTNI